MKIVHKLKRIFFIAAAILPLFIASCVTTDGDDPSELNGYEPEYITREQLNASIKVTPPRALNATGKIYVKDNFLIIIEPSVGLHIFNNANPQNPQPVKFIEVAGINDVAIKNDLFCVDNLVDMVFFKYDFNTNQINIVNRMNNFFPEPIPPGYRGMPKFIRPSINHIVVRWIQK